MISDSEWASIFEAIENQVSKQGQTLMLTKVIKSDPNNKLVWVPECGDQPVPLLTFDYSGKYYDTDDPVGTIKVIAGVNVPSDSLLAAGQSLLRTAYPDLFTEIGTRYGSVDGTHFSLPDLRAKFIYGSFSADFSDVGNIGGEINHALTTAELASHSHAVTDTGHSHSLAIQSSGVQVSGYGLVSSAFFQNNVKVASGLYDVTASNTTGISIQNTGSGTAHNNLPPYVRMVYTIKATGPAVVEKNSKISLSVPSVGDLVFVAFERGTRRLPRCLGKMQSKNYIVTTLDDA